MDSVGPDDKKCCIVEIRYQRINDKTFRQIGDPDIVISDQPWSTRYMQPQIEEIPREVGQRRQVVARLYDPNAVDLNRDDLLGDCSQAIELCDKELGKKYDATIWRT